MPCAKLLVTSRTAIGGRKFENNFVCQLAGVFLFMKTLKENSSMKFVGKYFLKCISPIIKNQ